MTEAIRSIAPGAKPVASLASALRQARIEGAERSHVVAELRGAEMARLEMLQEAIQPLLAQVPAGIDLFDPALVPGEQPRLFVDMIGFVEMGRDRRLYRFLQDTRHGRVLLAESDKIDAMIDAVRHYIARRLLEREKALASDQTVEQAARALIGQTATAAEPVRARKPRHRKSAPLHIARFVIEFFGVFTVTMLLLGAGLLAYAPLRAWLSARFGWPAA